MSTTQKQLSASGVGLKKQIPLSILLAVLCSAGMLPLTGRSATFLTNLTQPHSYNASVSYTRWIASRFLTDNTSASFSVTKLTLGYVAPSVTGGNFDVSIYSTTGSSGSETVGSLVGVLSGDSSPDASGQYAYTSPGLTLQANTSYWLVTKVTAGSGNYSVGYTANTAATGGWTIPSTMTYRWSDNQGSNWNAASGGSFPYLYEIEGVAIPEPGSVGLIVGGLLIFGMARRRRYRPDLRADGVGSIRSKAMDNFEKDLRVFAKVPI